MLCSNDLPSDGEFIFTIKAIKVIRIGYPSFIRIGIMESKMKGKKIENTWNHCVFLSLPDQAIFRGNDDQTDYNGIDCKCKRALK